jgi:hypothetical protein
MLEPARAHDRNDAPLAVGTPAEGLAREAALRAELEALHVELRELKSTDHAVRAYFASWFALVTGSIACKLVFDWQKLQSKPPIVAAPLAVLALAFLAKAWQERRAKARLAAHEDVRLARQRELRKLLGVEDAPVPPLAPGPALVS